MLMLLHAGAVLGKHSPALTMRQAGNRLVANNAGDFEILRPIARLFAHRKLRSCKFMPIFTSLLPATFVARDGLLFDGKMPL